LDEQAKNRDLEASREHGKGEFLTTNQGVRVGDDHNSLKVGSRGPTLLEDFLLREKITHFDHERIPERVVHARGAGAHGYFQVYESMAQYTTARFLQDPAVRTPVFVRFSTVVGSRGSADTVRDVRGFATKFYTEDGIFDLVGNNIPIFFIQDAVKFPDLVHAVKPEPHHEMPQAASAHDTFWDFAWLTPEITHMLLWAMSDRAIPRSFRTMDGFGVNTFRFLNARGKAHFVKFHWKPLLGTHSLVWDEAQKIAGKDPDFLRRDLWEAIEMGDYPEYEFAVQLIAEEDELKFDFDPLDPTKIWPEAVVPLRRIGKLVLDRNPDNFFAETEQVAFCPTHIVPGIDFSNDPLLQGRLFSYIDTQLTRLGGPNFAEIPINRSVAPVHNNQRDGFMRHTINPGRASYHPNSLGGGCPMHAPGDPRAFASFAERLDAHKVRERSPSFKDHFSQATLFWNSQSEPEQEHIIEAFRFELGKVATLEIRQHVVELLTNVDANLASQVALGIGVAVPKGGNGVSAANSRLQKGWDKYGATDRPGPPRAGAVTVAPELSLLNTVKGSIKSRRVAILAADGVDGAQLAQVKKALEEGGAHPEVISRVLGTIKGADGKAMPVDKTFLTAGSVLYDAVYLPGGQKSVDALKREGDVRHFINEAYRHGKPIAATGEGVDLLQATDVPIPPEDGRQPAGTAPDDGVIALRQAADLATAAQQFIAAIGQHRFYTRAQKEQIPA
jgi:catalase